MKAEKLFDVAGKMAVVTGAASGLGSAMAEVLAVNGARVVLADIDAGRLDEVAASLKAQGCDVATEIVDIGDFARTDAVIARIAARHGGLDAVFANAATSAGPGYGSPEGAIENVSLDRWEQSMHVNLTGTFATVQSAARIMKVQRRGSIIVTASISALKTSPLPAYAYHAAKAGVAQMVRVAAKELGPYNVRINAIAPGPFMTNMANGRMRDPEAIKKFIATVPLGRMGQIDEIKGLALLLASSASSYINGAVIAIDGGDSA
jgi:NAD(P)-dependent dehydrogenase (short-subunit alcohol dehydrogenase family)